MESKSKYIGKIYDGLWQVIDCKLTESERNYCYTLENVMNHNKVIISHQAIMKLERKETTVSSVIHRHILKKGGGNKMTFVFSKGKGSL